MLVLSRDTLLYDQSRLAGRIVLIVILLMLHDVMSDEQELVGVDSRSITLEGAANPL